MNYIAKQPTVQSVEDQIAEIFRLLRPLLRLSEEVSRNLPFDTITPAMTRVLMSLQALGPETVPTLARMLGTGRQYIQRMVNDLLAQELVDRKENPAHKKSMLIVLTDRGQECLDEASHQEHDAMQTLSEGLSGEDLQTCLDVLERLMGKIDHKAASGKRHPVTADKAKGMSAPLRDIQVRQSIKPQTIEPDPDPVPDPVPESEPKTGPEQQRVQDTGDESKGNMPLENRDQNAVLNWNGGGGLSIV